MFLSRRLPTLVGLAVVVSSLGAWTTAASAASPVGPKQVFVGLVNGKLANAEIRVGCFGPVYPGETGHLLPGQSVEVLPAASTGSTAGYTGTKAREVKLSIVLPVSSGVVALSGVVLADYGVPVALPTSWSLPCSGPGVALFLPEPTSKTARSAAVSVSFISPGVTSRIVARPTHLMVNQIVGLTGTGFAPATSLTLVECSLTNWIVPQNPCLSDNSVTVTTSISGSFATSMRAEICPAVSPPAGTERTCYIGIRQPTGVDTVRLEAAARIVVSWP